MIVILSKGCCVWVLFKIPFYVLYHSSNCIISVNNPLPNPIYNRLGGKENKNNRSCIIGRDDGVICHVQCCVPHTGFEAFEAFKITFTA